MSSGWCNKSNWGEEEVTAMKAAAMPLRRRWASDNATRSNGRVRDNVTRAGSNVNGKQQDWAANIAMKVGG
jgi:hypothetical protein